MRNARRLQGRDEALNLAVCVKHAIDETQLQVGEQGAPNLKGSATKMSTFDKNAVEEAVRLKTTAGGSVTIFSVGTVDAKKTMKEALAMGGDKGVLIISELGSEDTLTTSYLLAKAIVKFGHFDLVLCAEGSSDTYSAQVGPMIAEWLSLPYMGYLRRLEVGDGGVRGEAALEDRIELSEAAFPATVSVVSEINEPRYPTLIQIMQASKKPIEEVRSETLRGQDAPEKKVLTTGMKVQSMRRKNVIFDGESEESVNKLVEALVAEGVLKR